jgi:DNA-binding NarL/FixJ family response regulator
MSSTKSLPPSRPPPEKAVHDWNDGAKDAVDEPAGIPAAAPPKSVSLLSKREREIVMLLSNGYAALNIAAKLNIARTTVRNHISNVLQKLEVHSRVEAVALSIRRGWI